MYFNVMDWMDLLRLKMENAFQIRGASHSSAKLDYIIDVTNMYNLSIG